MTEAEARLAMLTLLSARAEGATVCPSEVARALTDTESDDPDASDWRDAMPIVHAAVDSLLAENIVQVSWKGEALSTRTGPYRIASARSA